MMSRWAYFFLLIALLEGVMGLAGSAVAAQIAVMFFTGSALLAVFSLLRG